MLIKWVDDIGTKVGVLKLNGIETTVFEDSNGRWRSLGATTQAQTNWHIALIEMGRDHGYCQTEDSG